MSLSPASGVDQGAEQLGETVAVNLFDEFVSAKSIDVSPGKLVEVNPGSAGDEIVTDADAFDVYHEQSSSPGEPGFEVASTGATYESTDDELPLIPYARPLYFDSSSCVSVTSPETPSKCQAHCGTVPTDDPVEFEPVISAFAELRPATDSVRPNIAIGAIVKAITFFNIFNPFLG
jgi:hypothetical protein